MEISEEDEIVESLQCISELFLSTWASCAPFYPVHVKKRDGEQIEQIKRPAVINIQADKMRRVSWTTRSDTPNPALELNEPPQSRRQTIAFIKYEFSLKYLM